ncbi:type II toxin-antitoxin system VapC family toxin [Amycolatopsis sp. WQ 127309]|uniref:type II toxin-antitoxin system VapC family toxin n=1 Tax=Amycolatopsis sp. WQ 127309 TaxID=2932773 RepID=UPI001FF16B10|nr:type II toxin-antitoxin system VapC family toxin [Amycolatopsis sp. WQ 127309]UOZ05991.1 type II toxin-antitoxin system VapC family toxin [Amycolatopsis sp. WQ 127309]
MIIDSSAIVAILRQEPDHERLEERLAEADSARIGAPTLVEVGIVLTTRLGARGQLVLARFLQDNNIATAPFTEEHAEVAIEAFKQYGKGHHPAKLNMGDCYSYATAKVAREPLLCIGDDFPQTDLELVKLGS